MLKLLIVHELRSHLLTYRFAVSFLLLFFLVVSSATVLALNYERRLENHAATLRSQKERLQEATDLRTLEWAGIQNEKAPNPLSVFAVGLERELSRSVSVSRWQEAKLGRSKYASPLYTLFPAPDLLYIVNIVGSLLAVLFGFNAISGEHESGTLKLVMANSVPRHRVLLAKWLGGFAALLVPFMAAVLVALLIAQLLTALAFTADEWTAFGGMLVIAVLYMSVFYTLSLLISVLTHRAATSLVLAFLAWVLLVLVIPNIAPIVARFAVSVPSPGVIAGEREAIRRQVYRDLRDQMRQASRDDREALRETADTRIAEQTDKLISDYMQRVDTQVSLSITLARVSPSASYVYATSALSGSGVEGYSGLREYIAQYRQRFLALLEQLRQERDREAQGVTDRDERQAIRDAPIDPDDLPAFDPGRQSISDILVSADTDVLLLVLANAVCFLGAYVGFLRYDMMKG